MMLYTFVNTDINKRKKASLRKRGFEHINFDDHILRSIAHGGNEEAYPADHEEQTAYGRNRTEEAIVCKTDQFADA